MGYMSIKLFTPSCLAYGQKKKSCNSSYTLKHACERSKSLGGEVKKVIWEKNTLNGGRKPSVLEEKRAILMEKNRQFGEK